MKSPLARPLTGGVSSDIWLVETTRQRLCIKRALPALRVAAEWQAPSRAQLLRICLDEAREDDPAARSAGHCSGAVPTARCSRWRFLIRRNIRFGKKHCCAAKSMRTLPAASARRLQQSTPRRRKMLTSRRNSLRITFFRRSGLSLICLQRRSATPTSPSRCVRSPSAQPPRNARSSMAMSVRRTS